MPDTPRAFTCPRCASQVSWPARYCPSCGELLDSSGAPTRYAGGETPSAARPYERFVPGTILASRYRIIGLLGKGGMGEVYRADDLKLGQPVAMKFVPEPLASSAGRLDRFVSEVRLARQIAHPNVCRVYDLGEADGHHFITMEYVDGEDLASLLRRIGRLPGDKAVEIARQLCAGLAAAHEKGVLHRDLKPANVMIDGRGRVRITDFGLAGLEADLKDGDERAGTPTYMSPEQLAGREVTTRSDIYSLGLVLYEMFTGRAALRSDTLAGLMREQERSTPVTPGSILKGIDASVERAIMRCLEKDPRGRPASALAVAAALPGGDPLAAALAAGETPSPEMVAAAGEEGALRPVMAWACLLLVLAGLTAAVLTSGRMRLVDRVPMPRTPEALADRAREVNERLGYGERPGDDAHGFSVDFEYLNHVERHDRTAGRWDGLSTGQPPAIYFWYRQSPNLLVPENVFAAVEMSQPPMSVPGMTRTVLDPRGRLAMFDAIPPPVEAADAPGDDDPGPDWPALLAEAGLQIANLEAVPPAAIPPVHSDARAAWRGVYPDNPGVEVRVEAAAYRGRPVYLRLLSPWDDLAGTGKTDPGGLLAQSLRLGMLMVVLGGALFFARRNIRLGRVDRSGAFKIALYFLLVHLVVWAFWASHVPRLADEWAIFGRDTGWTLFNAAILWLSYLALEPYVRRRWPNTLISWNRLLAGRARDPLVGRDVLVGGAQGMIVCLTMALSWFTTGWLTGVPQPPYRPGNPMDLLGATSALAHVLDIHLHSMIFAMQAVVLIFLLRVLVRRDWLAVALFVILFSAQVLAEHPTPLMVAPFVLPAVWLFAFTLIRFGMLATMVAMFMIQFFQEYLITGDLTAWFAPQALLGLAAVGALIGWAFLTALAGRPVFGMLGDEAMQES